MALGNIGRVIAGQALETTKKSMMDALKTPDAPKPAEKVQTADRPAAHQLVENIASIILGQMQAMQRALKEDQELLVTYYIGDEKLRVLEIFVPSPHVFVLAGVDKDQNVTRAVIPAEAAHLVFKIMKLEPEAKAVRVNVLSPRPPATP